MLPELPLIDGCFFIDNSSLEVLQTCPRAFEYSRLRKRISASTKPSLDFGSAIHLALEWRYRNRGNAALDLADEEEQAKVLTDFYANIIQDEGEHRTLNFALDLTHRYNERYKTEPFNLLSDANGKLMVELSFALPLYTYVGNGMTIPVIYTGKIDLPVSWDNQIIILDHKTSTMFFGPQMFLDEQRPSNQFLGYCWAFEQLTGRSVGGFCVNGIPTKTPPVKPKEGSLDAWYNRWFCRDLTYLALLPNALNNWRDTTIGLIDLMFWHYFRGDFPQFGRFVRSCSMYGGCQYKDACFDPQNRGSEILDSSIYTDNTWSPLKVPGKE